MATVVKMNVQGNLGYAADQVDRVVTLADLMAAFEEAVEVYGEDAKVVLFQANNRYGANFGTFCGELFTAEDDEDEEF